MTTKWSAFPHSDASYHLDAAALRKQWSRLHRGDREPWPKNADAQRAWQAFHAGEFKQAVEIGTRAATERGHYPDVDLLFERDARGMRFSHKSGEPY